MRSSRAAGAAVAVAAAAALAAGAPAAPGCPPTRPDMLGPFYEPDAPLRSKVGTGQVLRGTVRSSADCRPVPGARVELWLAGPRGYDADRRATVIADEAGRYVFESDPPRPYARRPPHVHVRVAHPGFRTLVTQHYPARERADETFDLVLTPGR